MISKVKTFANMPLGHKWIFVTFFFLVPMVEVCVKTIGLNRTIGLLRIPENHSTKTPDDGRNLVRLYAFYLYLYQKQFLSFGNCLARSVVLWFLLSRKGVETDLRFGMKKVGQSLLAHAWVEYQGEALVTDSGRHGDFAPFSESILPELPGR